jgi:hypothetical protein
VSAPTLEVASIRRRLVVIDAAIAAKQDRAPERARGGCTPSEGQPRVLALGAALALVSAPALEVARYADARARANALVMIGALS